VTKQLAELKSITGCEPCGAGQLPADPGAYLLAIHLSVPLNLNVSTLEPAVLPVGWYAYAGSAHGLGGIRARVARHFRRDKPVHWHVDSLTMAASDLHAFPVIGGQECDLLGALLERPGCRAAVTGFGSSDCRRCPSHLLAIG
jgi:Uri superfamily endonuclease